MKNSRQFPFKNASLRLQGFDYSKPGAYFITLICKDRIHRLGRIKDKNMILNEYGEIAHNEWSNLHNRFPNLELGAFQIMPNHIHGIIILNDSVKPGFTPGYNTEILDKTDDSTPTEMVDPTDRPTARVDSTNRPTARVGPTDRPTIGDIVGAYKSVVSNGCLKLYKEKTQVMGRFWQQDYYEIIIRDSIAFNNITNYIINNPAKWVEDEFKLK